MPTSRALPAVLLALLAVAPCRAAAEAAPRVRPPAERTLSAAKVALPRGIVVLVESTAEGRLEQATLFARVAAPQKVAFDLLADPASLGRLQPAMGRVEVRTRRGNAMTYDWVYGDAIAQIRGTTAAALAPPGAVQLRSLAEGFGPGEMLYRLVPDGPDGTLVALAISIDVTKASNPLLRWLARASPDFRQAWNLGYGVMALEGLQHEAALEAGGAAPPAPSGEVGAGPLRPLRDEELAALAPLLDLGRVTIIEADGEGRIAQAATAERVEAPAEALTRILGRPEGWDRLMRAIRVRGVTPTAEGHDLQMSFSFPAFSVRADMALVRRPDGCDLTSPSGRLRGSLLSFRTVPRASGSVLSSAARVRLRGGSAILRRMIDDDPAFGHALNAALLMTTSRAFAQGAEGRR